MGCDIHSMLEIHKRGYSTDANGEETSEVRWFRNDVAIFEYPYFDSGKSVSVDNFPFSPDPLQSRNYRLFAMLADVRNGYGFAGTDTGDAVEPISMPRGVPEDASPEWLREVEEWGPDLHSTSYFTLAELDAYDWDGVVFERGFITEQAYLAIRGTDQQPDGWSGGIGGPGIVTMTAAEYEALTPEGLAQIRAANPATDERWFSRGIYVQHQWATTRRARMGELAGVIDVMRASAPRFYDRATNTISEPDPTKIRIVFGFDN